ncbi:unnamed protein product [Urochloa humidicola]
MDAAEAHKVATGGGELGSGRGGSGNGEVWRLPGWRAPARAEVVVLGLLATLTLLLLALASAGRQPVLSSLPRSGLFVQEPGNV